MDTTLLKPMLDRLYGDFNYPDSAADPIQIVRRFDRADDREVVATLIHLLASSADRRGDSPQSVAP